MSLRFEGCLLPTAVLRSLHELLAYVCGEITVKAFFWHALQIICWHGGDVLWLFWRLDEFELELDELDELELQRKDLLFSVILQQ